MILPFEAIIAVDWSGAADERAQRTKIWSCLARPEGNGLEVEDLRAGWTRETLGDWLEAEAAGRPAVLIGLDFPFSYPAWFAGHVGRDWQDLALWCQRSGLAAAAGGHRPFWGLKGSRRPAGVAVYRRCEVALREGGHRGVWPKSAFQVAGAGAPGKGTLRGIPFLQELRQRGFAVWPFDLPVPGQPVVVEIYPRLFYGPLRKSRLAERAAHLDRLRERLGDRIAAPANAWEGARDNDDAFDALVSAVRMGQEAARPEHGFGRYPGSFYEDPAVALEGWIWGLPWP